MLDRKTQWLSLIAGGSLLLYGLRKLYLEGDWVLVILGVLIMAFTASSMVRNKSKKP